MEYMNMPLTHQEILAYYSQTEDVWDCHCKSTNSITQVANEYALALETNSVHSPLLILPFPIHTPPTNGAFIDSGSSSAGCIGSFLHCEYLHAFQTHRLCIVYIFCNIEEIYCVWIEKRYVGFLEANVSKLMCHSDSSLHTFKPFCRQNIHLLNITCTKLTQHPTSHP